LPEPRYRVLAIGSHPVQYMSPLFRRMAQHPQLDLSVAYCTLRGAQHSYDPDFNTTVKWDIPLLEGYKQEVPNRGPARIRSLDSIILVFEKSFARANSMPSCAFLAIFAHHSGLPTSPPEAQTPRFSSVPMLPASAPGVAAVGKLR
jgi:hypothetical protein